MLPISTYIKRPNRLGVALLSRLGCRILSDELYLKLRYRLEMGESLNLKNPRKFTEKIQWLKLYNRKPEYTTMVDKYAVKKFVADLIGEEHIIPTLGVWDKAEDIDFDTLPDKFVLKTTHGGGGGGVVICSDKSKFDRSQAIAHLKRSLALGDIYRVYKEWPYKNVPRRIIAEQFMEDEKLHELRDYKFFCFNGQCRCFKVDFDRFIKHFANYYDPDGHILDFGEADLPPQPSKKVELPSSIPDMIKLAETLSRAMPFLRVDFYDVNGKIYFGELTFFPASGLGKFTSEEWDLTLGEWITLPEKPRGGM